MKVFVYILGAAALFGAGFFAGEYRGTVATCKGTPTVMSKWLDRKSEHQLRLFTKLTCPYCHSAKELLRLHDIDYEEIDITGNDRLKAEMIGQAKGRKTVPQIFIGKTHIGGFDDLQTVIETFKPCPQ